MTSGLKKKEIYNILKIDVWSWNVKRFGIFAILASFYDVRTIYFKVKKIKIVRKAKKHDSQKILV